MILVIADYVKNFLQVSNSSTVISRLQCLWLTLSLENDPMSSVAGSYSSKYAIKIAYIACTMSCSSVIYQAMRLVHLSMTRPLFP